MKSNEIILSQLLVHLIILIIQIVIVLFTALYMFSVRIHDVFITLELKKYCFLLDTIKRKFIFFIIIVFHTRILWHDIG